MTEIAWSEFVAVFLVSLVVPLVNLLVGLLRPANCGADQFLGLAPSVLLVVLGSIELVLVLLTLARVASTESITYHGLGLARFCIDTTLCFLVGAALFPTATAACYGSTTFGLLVADFCLYIASLAILLNEWFHLARDALRLILCRPG